MAARPVGERAVGERAALRSDIVASVYTPRPTLVDPPPDLAHHVGMKVETTIALPTELLQVVDERSSAYGGRSRLIEAAIRAFVGVAARAGNRAQGRHRSRQVIDLPVFKECRPLKKLPSRAELYDEIYGAESFKR